MVEVCATELLPSTLIPHWISDFLYRFEFCGAHLLAKWYSPAAAAFVTFKFRKFDTPESRRMARRRASLRRHCRPSS
eukprot:scaffold3801_cov150-Skeletonema_menzelii.AAC.3